jgi:hypothetical protein
LPPPAGREEKGGGDPGTPTGGGREEGEHGEGGGGPGTPTGGGGGEGEHGEEAWVVAPGPHIAGTAPALQWRT